MREFSPMRAAAWVLAATLCGPGESFAQANSVPGLDLAVSGLGDAAVLAREGTFPAGVNGMGIAADLCNVGTTAVSTAAAMAAAHPVLAFLVARESGGRFVQISDRSFVSHLPGASSTSACGVCTGTGTPALLGVGCGVSRSAAENGDHFWLGPADEVHPWLGTWTPACSHFDRGEPAVPPPADCDGVQRLRPEQRAPRPHRERDRGLPMSGARSTHVTWVVAQASTVEEGGRRPRGARRPRCASERGVRAGRARRPGACTCRARAARIGARARPRAK